MTRTEISIATRQYVTGRVITGINYLIILLITSIESAVVRPWRGPSRVTPVSTAVPPSTPSNRQCTRVVAICNCPCTPLVRAHRLLVVGPALQRAWSPVALTLRCPRSDVSDFLIQRLIGLQTLSAWIRALRDCRDLFVGDC